MAHTVFLMTLLITLSTHAAEQCQSLFNVSTTTVSIEANQVRPLVFTNTEVLRRNNDIGQQQVGELRIEKWFELPPYNQGFYNFIGMTGDGKVYHIVDWEGRRRIARLLSGNRQLSQMALINNEILLALNAKGQVFMYSPDLWRKSPRNTIMKQALQIQGGLWASLTSILYLIAPQSFDAQFLPLVAGTTGVLSSMQAGFWALFKYEKLNTYPDGFRKTPWTVEKLEDLSSLAEEILRTYNQTTPLMQDMNPVPPESMPAPHPEATEDIR